MFYTRSENHTWIEFLLRSFSLLTIASSIIQNFAATPFELQRLSEVDKRKKQKFLVAAFINVAWCNN
jgi:hypothetical protein